MKRLGNILGYTNDVKSNFMLFGMQLVVISLPMLEHLNSWAIIIMTLIWLATLRKSNFKIEFKSRKLGIYFIAYFLWLLIGLTYTEDINNGLSDLLLKFSFFLFPFVLLFNKRIDQHFLRGIVRAFYYTMFVVSIILLLMAFKNLSLAGDISSEESLSYFTYEKLAQNIKIQPIYLSMYMVFAFFCVIWDFFIDPRIGLTNSGKWMARIWAFHYYAMVILLSSRMELLVLLFVSSVGLAYFDGIRKKKWLVAGIKMMVLASFTVFLLGLFPVNKARYEEMVDISNDYTKTQYGGRSIRLHKWKNSLELILEQPILGTGAGDMQAELQKVYKRNNFDLAYEFRFNPHNQYLQTWAAAGLIGLALLIAILFSSLKYSIDSKSALYVALVLILATSMLTESILERQKGLVFFSFFLLFFASYYFNHKERLEALP